MRTALHGDAVSQNHPVPCPEREEARRVDGDVGTDEHLGVRREHL
jgi:hypothetical protein